VFKPIIDLSDNELRLYDIGEHAGSLLRAACLNPPVMWFRFRPPLLDEPQHRLISHGALKTRIGDRIVAEALPKRRSVGRQTAD
jgi:hypothetical protein